MITVPTVNAFGSARGATGAQGTQGPQGAQGAGGGGGGGSFENVAYIDSVNGNDTTGDGSEGNPYATVQKAYNEAFTSFVLSKGGYAQLSLTANATLAMRGQGYFQTSFGGVTTNGFNLELVDVGHRSFGLSSEIIGNGVDGGSNGGSLILHGIYAPGRSVSSNGAAGVVPGQVGGQGGSIFMYRCAFDTVNAAGGDGALGDGSTSGANGGPGGAIGVYRCDTGTCSTGGGAGGGDGGAGNGSPGGEGTTEAFFSQLNTSLTTATIKGCILGGTWQD